MVNKVYESEFVRVTLDNIETRYGDGYHGALAFHVTANGLTKTYNLKFEIVDDAPELKSNRKGIGDIDPITGYWTKREDLPDDSNDLIMNINENVAKIDTFNIQNWIVKGADGIASFEWDEPAAQSEYGTLTRTSDGKFSLVTDPEKRNDIRLGTVVSERYSYTVTDGDGGLLHGAVVFNIDGTGIDTLGSSVSIGKDGEAQIVTISFKAGLGARITWRKEKAEFEDPAEQEDKPNLPDENVSITDTSEEPAENDSGQLNEFADESEFSLDDTDFIIQTDELENEYTEEDDQTDPDADFLMDQADPTSPDDQDALDYKNTKGTGERKDDDDDFKMILDDELAPME